MLLSGIQYTTIYDWPHKTHSLISSTHYLICTAQYTLSHDRSTAHTYSYPLHTTHSFLSDTLHIPSYRLHYTFLLIGYTTHSFLSATLHIPFYRLHYTFLHIGYTTHSFLSATLHIPFYRLHYTFLFIGYTTHSFLSATLTIPHTLVDSCLIHTMRCFKKFTQMSLLSASAYCILSSRAIGITLESRHPVNWTLPTSDYYSLITFFRSV